MGARGQGFKYSGAPMAADPAWRVVVALGPSRLAAAWIALVALATAAAALLADLPGQAGLALVAAVAVAAVRSMRREALRRGPGAVRRLAVGLDGAVAVDFVDGRAASGTLAPGAFVAPRLVVVRWRPAGARLSRTLAVPADAAEAGAHRRLRILLRWR